MAKIVLILNSILVYDCNIPTSDDILTKPKCLGYFFCRKFKATI